MPRNSTTCEGIRAKARRGRVVDEEMVKGRYWPNAKKGYWLKFIMEKDYEAVKMRDTQDTRILCTWCLKGIVY